MFDNEATKSIKIVKHFLCLHRIKNWLEYLNEIKII